MNVAGAAPPSVRRIRPKNEVEEADLRTRRAKAQRDELDLLFDTAARLGAETAPKIMGQLMAEAMRCLHCDRR